MDIRNIINDGAPPPTPNALNPQRASPTAYRYDHSHASPNFNPNTNGHAKVNATPPAAHPQYQARPTPPAYPRPPPSLDRQTSGSYGPPSSQLTPLQTSSSHIGGGSRYPFPSQTQSPSQAEPQRPQDRHTAVTPGARAPSHPYQHQQTPSSYFGPPAHPVGLPLSASHSNASATPPSLHNRSPAIQESPHPGSASNYGSHSQHQQHSQPSTPLGPPPLQHPRFPSQGHRETPVNYAQSPYASNQRAYPGVSPSQTRSIASQSPAQTHAPLGHLTESPAGFGPSMQYKRRSTDYAPSDDRERSVSVSPKTRVYPSYPSAASRRESHSEYSARGSMSSVHQDPNFRPPSSSNSFSGPGQLPPRLPGSTSEHQNSFSSPPTERKGQGQSQSNVQGQSQSQPIHNQPPHHQGQIPHLNRLLGGEPSFSPSSNNRHSEDSYAAPDEYAAAQNSHGRKHSIPIHTQIAVDREAFITHGNSPQARQERLDPASESRQRLLSLLERPLPNTEKGQSARIPSPASQDRDTKTEPTTVNSSPLVQLSSQDKLASQKRPAMDEPEARPVQKKLKHKYAEPPIWARLAPSNPRYKQQIARFPQLLEQPTKLGKKTSPQPAAVQPTAQPVPRTNGHAHPMTNGGPPHNREIYDDRVNIARILGVDWEGSITDTIPSNELLRSVADFLYIGMLSKPELGAGDTRNGALEIEAKIGTLINRNTDRRLELPVTTATVLQPNFSKQNIRFESFMTEAQHKNMNVFLNACVQKSMQPPRVPMGYIHRYELDSFATMSPAGVAALPSVAKEHLGAQRGNLRVRTTVNTDPKLKAATPPVIARIVKLRLADVDIFSPGTDFDARISINIEIDFHGRTDIDPSLIGLPKEQEPAKERQPDRHKNRLSYKHLAYSIDLTQVTNTGTGEKTHELEVEVDTQSLRQQAVLLSQRKENAFEGMVKGMLDNVALLMKFKAEE